MTNDVRERLQETARTIAVILPPGTGFILLAFDFDQIPHASKLEYVANCHREDALKVMAEFIQKNKNPDIWSKHT